MVEENEGSFVCPAAGASRRGSDLVHFFSESGTGFSVEKRCKVWSQALHRIRSLFTFRASARAWVLCNTNIYGHCASRVAERGADLGDESYGGVTVTVHPIDGD